MITWISKHKLPQETSLLDRCGCYGVLHVLPVIMSNKLLAVNQHKDKEAFQEVLKNAPVSKYVQTLLQYLGISGT